MKFVKYVVLILLLSNCSPALKMNDKGDKKIKIPSLPDKIYFRTKTENFNKKYYLALRDGRIFYKVRKKGKKWKIFGKTGVPEGCHLKKFSPPKKVIAISSDGVHIIALSEKGIFYRGTNMENDPDKTFYWRDEWGWPAASGPGLKVLNKDAIWAVSDSHPFNIKYYRDGNGKKHSVGFGVAHLYMVENGGKTLHFNDWWLPADWSREIPLPNRGKFKILNMSASGSTIMVINREGEIYTRMYDFDISGENSLLTYTFIDKKPANHVRKLPMPNWKKQPPIDGMISSKITIFQTGKGNKNRVLRVEGIKGGKSGFFYKKIDDKKWDFFQTDRGTTEPLLNTRDKREEVKPFRDEICYVGKLKKKGIKKGVTLKIVNFKPYHFPADIEILIDNKPLIIDDEKTVLKFHHRHSLVKTIRPYNYWDIGKKGKIWGAIVFPEDFFKKIDKIKDKKVKNLLKKYFKKIKVITFDGEASKKEIKIKQLSIWNLFKAPMKEKGGSSEFKGVFKKCK